jgi:hypothetical protein
MIASCDRDVSDGTMIELPDGAGGRSGPTAVILSGLIHRSLRHVVSGLREKVLSPLGWLGEVDLFYHSWDVAEIRNPRAGEHGVTVDPGEVALWLPEARGIFESQEEFDGTIGWEALFARNPMRHCTGNEAAARATLMNYRRAIESQERAWRFFQQAKTRDYARVVVTRADLRFLDGLEVPAELTGEGEFEGNRQPRLWLPRFHSWGGVNDRFAIGSEAVMGVYSQRAAFVDGWLLSGGQGNPETILMKWLQRNGVGVGFLDFVFQRIRATGEVTEMDRDLKPASKRDERAASAGIGASGEVPMRQEITPAGEPPAVRERFLILAREAGSMADQLREVLAPLGKVEVIVDRAPEGAAADSESAKLAGDRAIFYPDPEVQGYGGLMSQSSPFPTLTAWSRAMYHLSKTLEPDEAIWFVEDDVAGNAAFFEALVRETADAGADLSAIDIRSRRSDPHWHLWSYAEPWFPEPWRAFKPLCRKSARLIRAALEFRERHGRFAFHEILFPTLANESGMRFLDWNRGPDFRRLLTCFRFRPAVDHPMAGICHPVKREPVHGLICAMEDLPPPKAMRPEVEGMPRFSRAGFHDGSLQPDEYMWLVRTCRRGGFKAVVEIGCGDSTLALLDGGCRVLALDPDPEWRAHHRRKLADEVNVEFRGTAERRIAQAGSLPFRPDFVLVTSAAIGGGRVDLLEACEFGLTAVGKVLLLGTGRPGVADVLEGMKIAGRTVRRLPTSSGAAWILAAGSEAGGAADGMALAARYRGLKTHGWYHDDFERWSVWIAADEPVRVLEVGASDGVSANVMLDALFPHPESEVHCIEAYDDIPELPGFADSRRDDFAENARRGRHEERLHLYEGTAVEILAWMIAGEGYWESFDFIRLGEELPQATMLAAACQSWNLLKSGGVLAFAARGKALDGFVAAFGDQVEPFFDGASVAVRKRIPVSARSRAVATPHPSSELEPVGAR